MAASRSSIDIHYMGLEPEWLKNGVKNNSPITELELSKAYNWYTYFKDEKDAKSYFMKFLEEQKTGKNILARIEKYPAYKFITLGWTARMLSRGCVLPKPSLEWFKNKLKLLITNAPLAPDIPDAPPYMMELANNDLVSIASTKSQKENIFSSIENVPAESLFSDRKFSDLVAFFDSEIDKFHQSYSSSFEPYKWLKDHEIKAHHAKKLSDYYKNLQKELEMVLDKSCKDEQLLEGYSNIKKSDIKKILEFITKIINDCSTITQNSKLERKPRKKKIKTATQLTKKVAYKESDTQYKLQSINPSLIIGSEKAFFFNTKTRMLSLYVAKDPKKGLNIKGTTIIDYDEKLSFAKKLRKPEGILQSVINGGKVSLRTIMDGIKSIQSQVNGRINKETIILKVLKAT